MVEILHPDLGTRGTRVFCPTENTDLHEEFRPEALSFLGLGASEIIQDHAKTTPSFLHPRPFLDHQVNEVRSVAILKRKFSRAPAPSDAIFLLSGDLNVIWRDAIKTKISGLVADKKAGLLSAHHGDNKVKWLCETYNFNCN